jgi:hypothetical protein
MITLPPSSQPQRPRATVLLWVVVFAAGAVLYVATAQRGANWQDSGTRQWRMLTGEYDDPLGLALVHPLYLAIGQAVAAVPIGSVLGRMNALSAVAMAAALANLACVVRRLSGRWWAGLGAAAMLAVCHTPWWLATITESYTLNAALFTAELWVLVALLQRPRWPLLVGLAAVCGLDWSVHDLALLALPVYAVVAAGLIARRRLPAWSVAAAAAALVAGAAPYWVLIVHRAQATGDLTGAIGSALFGNYRANVLNVSATWPMLRANAALAAMNFVSFLPVLAVVGWAALGRLVGRATAWALAAITVIEVLFVARYSITDQFTFLLPSLVMIALAAGMGLAALAGASAGWRRAAVAACAISVLLPPALYAAAPALARRAGVQVHRRRQLPFRDEMRYWLVPWKYDETSADRFARAALTQAGRDAVILLDLTTLNAVRVTQKVDRLAPTVLVTNMYSALAEKDAFGRALAGRKLYVLSPDPLDGQVLREAIWTDTGPVPVTPAQAPPAGGAD